jgi:hypothetical protein
MAMRTHLAETSSPLLRFLDPVRGCHFQCVAERPWLALTQIALKFFGLCYRSIG